jgi:hypothetical protein
MDTERVDEALGLVTNKNALRFGATARRPDACTCASRREGHPAKCCSVEELEPWRPRGGSALKGERVEVVVRDFERELS